MTSEQLSINLTVLWKCSDTPNTGIFLDWRDREKKKATLQKNLQVFPVLTLTETNSSRKESPPGVAALCCSRGTSSLSSRIPALQGQPGTTCAQGGDCSGTRHKHTHTHVHQGAAKAFPSAQQSLSCPKQHLWCTKATHPWVLLSHPTSRHRAVASDPRATS